MTAEKDQETLDAEEMASFTPADEPETSEPENTVDDEPDAEIEADPSVNDEADEAEAGEAGEGDEHAEEGKKRSKPLHKRLGETTEKWRKAEARAAELEERIARLESGEGDKPTELTKPDPNDDKYEFGEADPKYITDLTRYEIKAELAAERAERETAAQREKVAEAGRALDTQWAERVDKASGKYEDFNEVVVESAAAGEWPLLPLSAAALQGSEVGDDIAYHLAKNRGDAEKLANLERQFHATRNAALESGIKPELALQFARPYLDMATEVFNGLEAKFKDAGKKGKIATEAPEPAKHQVRGGGGRFEVDGATTDFAAFEKKANASMAGKR